MSGTADAHAAVKPATLAVYARLLCGFTLALTCSTWRLWTAQTQFPQVPLFGLALRWPTVFDTLGLLVWGLGLACGVWGGADTKLGRTGMLMAWVALLSLIVSDQHRLQPWAYFYLLAAPPLTLLAARQSTAWLRALTASLYFFSAISKLDVRFLQTTGALFLATLLQRFGIHIGADAARLSWILPVGELIVAVTLALRFLRSIGIVLAVVLHISLLLILGPGGLDHRWGVLVWNVTSIALVVALFRDRSSNPASQQTSQSPSPAESPAAANDDAQLSVSPSLSPLQRFSLVPLIIGLLMPLTEPWGWWDSWLSWGLYSTRAARVELLLAPPAVQQLPTAWQQYCQQVEGETWWHTMRLDLWSLQALEAPLVPSDRFQLAVSRDVLQTLPEDARQFQLLHISAPDRRTGQTSVSRAYDLSGVDKLAGRFWLNSVPRDNNPKASDRH